MAKNIKEKYSCIENFKPYIFIINSSFMQKRIIYIVIACLIAFSSFAQSNSSNIKLMDTLVNDPPPPPPPPSSAYDSGIDIAIPENGKNSSNKGPNETFVMVEEMPHFIGGDAALYDFIRANTRYPMMEKKPVFKGKYT